MAGVLLYAALMLSFVAAAVAAAALAAKLAFAAWRFRALPLPAPPSLSPILGHACSLMSEASPVKLAEFAAQLGPLYKLRLFDTTMCVLVDPAEAARVFRLKGAYKPDVYRAFDLPSTRGRESMFTAPGGQYWRAVRTAVAPCFSMTSLKRTFPWLLGLTQSAVDGIAEQLGPAGTAVVDVSDLACRLTSDTIGDMLVAQDFGGMRRWRRGAAAAAAAASAVAGDDGADDTGKDAAGAGNDDRTEQPVQQQQQQQTQAQPPDYVPLVRGYLAAVHEKINDPLVGAGLARPSRAHRAALAAWDAAVGAVAARARAAPPPDYTIAARLLAMTDPETGKPLDAARLGAELSIMYIAGFETTSHAIAWTLGLLASHPCKQAKLAAELQAAGLSPGGGGGETSMPREFQWADLGRLPYLGAVLRESLRLYAPAAGGSLRALPTDAVVCGAKLPKGTFIAQPLYALGRAASNYGADADSFRPERWLPAERAVKEEQEQEGDRGGGATDPPITAAVSARDAKAGGVGSGSGVGSGGSEPARDTAAAADTAKKAAGSGGGDTAKAAFTPPPDPLSFSVGPRDCVGQALAMLELQVVIATLVGRFAWSLPPGAPRGPPADVYLRDKLCYHVTLFPRGGLELAAAPRV